MVRLFSVGHLLDSPSCNQNSPKSLDPASIHEQPESFEIQPESSDIQIINSEMPMTTETEIRDEQGPDENGLDAEALEILGIDPTTTTQYGKEIHNELATRLQHIATTGLTKELRKELTDRYLIPANCIKIGAPSMNPEIKAAVTEVIMKRDKGIEARQKQLAAAISGLTAVLNNELDKKEKNSNTLKQLMDVSRILCDIQHAESVTRRNFAAFSIKKELKDHLFNTKIDTTLFGENLAETLKSAKAVSKSGSDLKTKPPPKPKAAISSSAPTNLNWRGPAPARRYQAPLRNQENNRLLTTAPGSRPRFSLNQTHASSSKTSQPPSKQTRRR